MRKRQTKPSTTTAKSRRSAAYWRTLYEQLKSDFEELLAVNQTIIRRNAELEGRTVVTHHHVFHNVENTHVRRPFGNSPRILPYPVPGGIR